MTVPLDNVKMSVGDVVTVANSAQAGYLGLGVAGKPVLGVLTGFVHSDGTPITPQNLGGHTTASVGPVCDDLTASSDGAAFGQVSVSPSAVYSALAASTPSTTTYYGGTGCDIVITTGAQTVTLGTPGTTTALSTMIIPWGTGTRGKRGVDEADATRVNVIFTENELFGGSYAVT
jgi:hypothetical protein